MNKPLLGEKLAVLVANGFNEKDLVDIQRALQPMGISMRIVGMNHGLLNSWNGEGWGLNFAADQVLNTALSTDFSMLIIPGGQRSAEKLQLTAHTNRFINGFLESGKPVVVMGEALGLLAENGKLAGRTVSGMDSMKAAAEKAGATWSDTSYAIDGTLMTGDSLQAGSQDFVSAMGAFLMSSYAMEEAA